MTRLSSWVADFRPLHKSGLMVRAELDDKGGITFIVVGREHLSLGFAREADLSFTIDAAALEAFLLRGEDG